MTESQNAPVSVIQLTILKLSLYDNRDRSRERKAIPSLKRTHVMTHSVYYCGIVIILPVRTSLLSCNHIVALLKQQYQFHGYEISRMPQQVY